MNRILKCLALRTGMVGYMYIIHTSFAVMNVSFSETSLAVSEGGGFFELTLTKTEGAVGPVTVNLVTTPMPGSEGNKYNDFLC